MPSSGPQPPTDGPFILILTVTAGTPEAADELAGIFSSHRTKALEQGAKNFIVGRKVDGNTVTVFEQYDDVKAFEAYHSPIEKTEEYHASRARTAELKETMIGEFFRVAAG